MQILATNQSIKKCAAALMLLIFALSATPKKILHDAFANHKDFQSPNLKEKVPTQKIAASAFHCQCDDLVVEAPFFSDNVSIKIFAPVIFSVKQLVLGNNLIASVLLSFGLRGPPAFA